MSTETIPYLLSNINERFAFMRTGIVNEFPVDLPGFVLVTVGEVDIPMAYLRDNPPLAGDLVQVVRQGASWVCLGALSAQPPT